MPSLGAALSGLARFTALTGGATVAVSLLTGAIGQLVTVVGGLGAGLVQASGAIGLLPAVGAAAAASIAALVVGFQGFGDAIKAISEGDAAKFNEALQQLTPNAREAARALRELRPAFTEIREAVQESLFAGLAPQLGQLGSTLLPSLRSGLAQVASGLSAQLRAVLAEINTQQFTRDLDTMFRNTAQGARAAAPGMRAFASALNQIAAVGSSFLPRLGRAFSRVGEQFEAFIERTRASGQLEDWIEGGINAVNRLGRTLRDFGAGIANVFRIADTSGASVFQRLESMAASFRSFTESTAGQQQLGRLFESLGRAGDAVAPVFRQLFDTLVQLSPVFADIAEKVGPKLSEIIEAVGDALEDIGPELGDSLVGIGDALKEILPSVVQLIGPFSSLLNAVLRPLVPVVEALAPVLGLVAEALASLLNAVSDSGRGPLVALAGGLFLLRRRLKNLPGRITSVATALGTLGGKAGKGKGGAAAGMGAAATAAGRLSRNVKKIPKGRLALLGGLLAGFLVPEGVGDNLIQISDSVEKLNKGAEILTGGDGRFDLTDTFNGVDVAVAAAADGFRGLAAVLTGNEEALRNLRSEWTTTVRGVAEAAPELRSLGSGALVLTYDVETAAQTLKRAFGIELPESVAAGSASIGQSMGSIGSSVRAGALNAATAAAGFGEALQRQLTSGIGSAAANIANSMAPLRSSVAQGAMSAALAAAGFGPQLQAQLLTGIGRGAAAVMSGMPSIGAAVASGAAAAGARGSAMSGPLSSAVRGATSVARSAAAAGMATVGKAIGDGARSAAQQAAGLGSQIRSVIGSINLYSVGYSIMQSLGAGIAAGGAAATNSARSIAGSIRGLFPASPAKWGPFAGDGHPERLGRKLMDYLAAGIRQGQRSVESAALGGARAAYLTTGFRPGYGATSGIYGGVSTTTNNYRTINAPITLTAPAADPRAVAAQIENRLDTLAARLAI